MNSAKLATLKFFALLFLLPGLAGLIVSAMVSTHYLNTLPRYPAIEQSRVIPRGIEGVTVYQTPQEDRTLNMMEYSSVGVFLVGLVLGLVNGSPVAVGRELPLSPRTDPPQVEPPHGACLPNLM